MVAPFDEGLGGLQLVVGDSIFNHGFLVLGVEVNEVDHPGILPAKNRVEIDVIVLCFGIVYHYRRFRGFLSAADLLLHPFGHHIGQNVANVKIFVELLGGAYLPVRIRHPVEDLQGRETEGGIYQVLEDRPVGLRRAIDFLGCWVDGLWYVRELADDFLLHLVGIDVSDHDDCLEVRTVPLVIEVQNVLPLEIVYHVKRSQYSSFCLLGSLVDEVGL